MTKWLLALAVTVIAVGIVTPGVRRRLRLGRLPGDISLRLRGRDYAFPFATTLVLSLLATLLFRLL